MPHINANRRTRISRWWRWWLPKAQSGNKGTGEAAKSGSVVRELHVGVCVGFLLPYFSVDVALCVCLYQLIEMRLVRSTRASVGFAVGQVLAHGPGTIPHPSICSNTLCAAPAALNGGGSFNCFSPNLELIANLTDCLVPKEFGSGVKLIWLLNALTLVDFSIFCMLCFWQSALFLQSFCDDALILSLKIIHSLWDKKTLWTWKLWSSSRMTLKKSKNSLLPVVCMQTVYLKTTTLLTIKIIKE